MFINYRCARIKIFLQTWYPDHYSSPICCISLSVSQPISQVASSFVSHINQSVSQSYNWVALCLLQWSVLSQVRCRPVPRLLWSRTRQLLSMRLKRTWAPLLFRPAKQKKIWALHRIQTMRRRTRVRQKDIGSAVIIQPITRAARTQVVANHRSCWLRRMPCWRPLQPWYRLSWSPSRWLCGCTGPPEALMRNHQMKPNL